MSEIRCPECRSVKLVKSGKMWTKNRKKAQRYRCNNCGRHTIYPVRK